MSVLVCGFVKTSCQPLIVFTHISQLILTMSPMGYVTTVTCSYNPWRRESKKFSDCKSHGLKSHQWLHRHGIHVPAELNEFFQILLLSWSPLSHLCWWCVVWSWSINSLPAFPGSEGWPSTQRIAVATFAWLQGLWAAQGSWVGKESGAVALPMSYCRALKNLIRELVGVQRHAQLTEAQVCSTLPQSWIYNPVYNEYPDNLQRALPVRLSHLRSRAGTGLEAFPFLLAPGTSEELFWVMYANITAIRSRYQSGNLG